VTYTSPGSGGGGGGAVSSVFTRTGAVVAQAGDYNISQITNAVTTVFGRNGAVVATGGDYTAAQVTNAADKSSGSQQLFTSEVAAPDVSAIGVPGAPQQARLIGGNTTGSPASGAHTIGDVAVDNSGTVWVCTASGTPGTWANVSAFLVGTNGTASIGADVACATANTFADGPTTGSIGANGQKFLVMGTVTILCGSTGVKYTARLWDGTTTRDETESVGVASNPLSLSLSAVISLTAATTFKISAAPSGGTVGGLIKAAAVDNSGATVASTIVWVRVA
jgi:hypothetical protein